MTFMSTTRRGFLKDVAKASGLCSMLPRVPLLFSRTALASTTMPRNEGTILVVVQLAGGNDGLNTVIPYADDHYAKYRRTLRFTANEVHKIDGLLGFHPEMSAFAHLLKEGLLTVVQGVGYPTPNQSHSTSMQIWQTAHPEEPAYQVGWLGRAADILFQSGKADVPAVFVGQIPLPFVLNARTAIVPAFSGLEDGTLRWMSAPAVENALPRLVRAAESSRDDEQGALLEFVRRAATATYALNEKIEGFVHRPTKVEYPQLPLANMLRTIAQWIRADVGVRIFGVELGGAEPGGFDNHANQRDNHASLLRQLSKSVAAFVEDLRRDHLLDRVLLMTYSEFGRTLAENGRRGTDHGSAAPMFLAGGALRGGLVGSHPSLADTEAGGVKHHTDFRQVYATVLDHWLGLDARDVLGGTFDSLNLLHR
jgi:uncharacterized protein (DUF1501 family)